MKFLFSIFYHTTRSYYYSLCLLAACIIYFIVPIIRYIISVFYSEILKYEFVVVLFQLSILLVIPLYLFLVYIKYMNKAIKERHQLYSIPYFVSVILISLISIIMLYLSFYIFTGSGPVIG